MAGLERGLILPGPSVIQLATRTAAAFNSAEASRLTAAVPITLLWTGNLLGPASIVQGLG